MIPVGTRAPRQRRAFDSWQIIYIDLMTNVMIFFVILWAIQTRASKAGVSDSVGTQTVKMVNLPGDVLFPSGAATLTRDGQHVLGKLFADDTGTVLNFDTGPLTSRLLVIHGHTDGDGDKEQNLDLGYRRAMSAYHEIKKYGATLPDHVVICTHADNSPAQEVPPFTGLLSPSEQASVSQAKSKNRRIAIEDKVVSRPKEGTK
jgi:outer membrane protein OmpA-like peptidoglycan-associated protein